MNHRLLRSVPLRVLVLANLVMAIAVVGCGESDNVKTVPVRGRLLVDGKPGEHAKLVFHPSGGDAELHKLMPRATVDKNGFYELKTYWTGDGAPPGEYKVTAHWKGPLPANAESEDFNIATYEERPDLLKGRYASPDTSGLRMTIQEPGDLPLLELTTK